MRRKNRLKSFQKRRKIYTCGKSPLVENLRKRINGDSNMKTRHFLFALIKHKKIGFLLIFDEA